jgi:hypothetical protein
MGDAVARHIAWPSRLAQALSVSVQRRAPCERRSTVVIPFGAFQLTYRGVVQHVQPAINRNRIKNIGVILNDQKTGPFAIEMAELSALRVDPSSNSPEVAAILRLNHLRGYDVDAVEYDPRGGGGMHM